MCAIWPFRCLSPECQSTGAAHIAFYLPVRTPKDCTDDRDNESLACPKCQTKRYLIRIENIHLIIHDPDGLIAGSDMGAFRGTSANFYSPACDRAKAMLAWWGGQWPTWFKFTTLPDASTCFDCNEYLNGVKLGGVVKSGLWLPLAKADRED